MLTTGLSQACARGPRAGGRGRTQVCRAQASPVPPKRGDMAQAAAAASPAPPALRGSDFVRTHLRTMAAYTPIEPFEVLSERLGRDPKDIIKLDANENPYGPPPGGPLQRWACVFGPPRRGCLGVPSAA